MSDKSKFRLDLGRQQIDEEHVSYVSRVAAYLLKPVPHVIGYNDKNPYPLELFYSSVISSMRYVPVKQLEFEEDFYFEDLDSAVSHVFSLFRRILRFILRFGRKRKKKKR